LLIRVPLIPEALAFDSLGIPESLRCVNGGEISGHRGGVLVGRFLEVVGW
jgi:hypothetical protein